MVFLGADNLSLPAIGPSPDSRVLPLPTWTTMLSTHGAVTPFKLVYHPSLCVGELCEKAQGLSLRIDPGRPTPCTFPCGAKV
jgi:hypothetical protein